MKHQPGQTDKPISFGSSTDWQVLGYLELPFGVDAHTIINAWLTEVLTPLHLQVDFLNKILKSAKDVAVRAMQPEVVIKDQPTHLRIYIPANCPLNGKTWSFFRIEKVVTDAENKNLREHSIEFYLFIEGQ